MFYVTVVMGKIMAPPKMTTSKFPETVSMLTYLAKRTSKEA